MSRKTMTITLSSGWVNAASNKNYRVEKVTDSVEYTPGMMLHENEVRSLCVAQNWRVTVIPYNHK